MEVNIWTVAIARLICAATTVPGADAWLGCLLLFIVYGAIALPVGFQTGLLKREQVTSWTTILITIGVTLVFPSLVEEIIFRALLLPHPSEHQSLGAIALWSGVSLVLFILAHPLNALWVMTSRRATFWDESFLTLAGLLGVVCTLTYLQSGSLWLPVLLHWVVVVIWLLALGGDRRMSAVTPIQSSPQHGENNQ